MRLIDADKLIDYFYYGIDDKPIIDGISDRKIIDIIKNQPTYYDVDKVVEELKERTDFLKDCTKYGNKNAKQQAESYSTVMMYEVADLVDDLIEIVKQGGVSDDVCEWKLEDDNLMTGCGDYFNLYDNYTEKFKYCPRCGKKIKVVE